MWTVQTEILTMRFKSLSVWGITVFLSCCVDCDATYSNHRCVSSDFLSSKDPLFIIDDTYTGVIQHIQNDSCPGSSQGCEATGGGNNINHCNRTCILSFDTNETTVGDSKKKTEDIWMRKYNESYQIYLRMKFRGKYVCFVPGKRCDQTQTGCQNSQQNAPNNAAAGCQNSQQNFLQNAASVLKDLWTDTGSSIQRICHVCEGDLPYGKAACSNQTEDTLIMFVNITKNQSCQLSGLTSVTKCVTCENPVEAPSVHIEVNPTTIVSQKGDINAAAASEFMEKLSDLLTQLGNESSAVITAGPVKGILTRQRNITEFKEVFFGLSSNSHINIVNSKVAAEEDFPGSVSISKEAFNKANISFKGGPFAGVFRFPNMSKDEKNSTVFNDEVIAIDMGTPISDLADSINITFQVNAGNTVMSCSSWNGTGDRPVWTTDGCKTTVSNGTVICQCTHLTFFAILMASPSESNISNSDLKSLSYITYIGCGLSMFFLGVALFMHFLLRRAKSSDATQILMNLFLAMFLLDLTFLSNEAVAGMGNLIACKIIAALLHYFMLSTFTWFAIEAFHLCLHLAKSFNIGIRHYFLKVCIGGWALPCVVVVIILICGKYGSLSVNSDNGKSVQMCWIIDDTVHYVVNIGYYALVFLFTFTVFIVIARQLTYLRGSDVKEAQKGAGPANICSIMGLCCLLGVTWGFAFFAYGPLRIPSYYIFTILNSFQGFFLFLYYYNTSKVIGDEKASSFSSSSTATIKTTTDSQNPYVNRA
ncbi:hypothetical protein MATL_G00208130 [Megalops atlanticus]|uniref:Uncharacterized protein n=1 Tax=Megalops atlanticus TaxID=7932 RepID=A0A9D3PIN1_MEGAT|nr:hypothetical protein MATL_G00208130 [Megalops atlanticus]